MTRLCDFSENLKQCAMDDKTTCRKITTSGCFNNYFLTDASVVIFTVILSPTFGT